MLDLGEDAFEHGNQTLQRALREFMRFYRSYNQQSITQQTPQQNRNEQIPVQEKLATDRQLDYLKNLIGEDAFQNIHAETLSREAISQLIRQAKDPDSVLFVMSEPAVKDAFAQVLSQNNIAYQTPASLDNVVLLQKGDFERLGREIQEAANTHHFDLETLTPLISGRATRDPIKSHDGMDIDSHSTVVESNGFQWKEDLIERISQARETTVTEVELEQRCREHGITLDRAADGEYLYRDMLSPHHQLRGDTIGERFTRKAFDRPESLADRAQNASDISKALSAMRTDPALDRTLPTR